MNKHNKNFLIFAVVLLVIITTKFFFEYKNIEQLKVKIVKEEVKALSSFMFAFRNTYQKVFVDNKIPIDEKTIHLLPVRTTKNISEHFSKLVNNTTIIKTVSDRARNENNQANKREMGIIDFFNKNRSEKSYFKNENNEIFYYAKPLYIKQGCLKCHGKREDAIPTIRDKYDKAYDYKLGDLRGILVLEISKNEIIRDIDRNYQNSIFVAIFIYFLFLSVIYLMIRIIVNNENKYTSTLEKKIKDEVEKNSKQQKQLFESEKMVQMGEMIGNISHQWRQPLSVISTSATGMLMQQELNMLDDESIVKYCNNINDNAQYLSKTIEDFKNYIKGERELQSIDIDKMIGKFLNLVEPTIKKHRIEIVLNLEKDLKFNGYENELIQCFINIFNNAKDVLKENEEINRLFFIQVLKEDTTIKIRFKDNGGGVPSDVIGKIFEPYFTTKHKNKGTGLGLHMSYDMIVKGMKGKLFVENIDYQYKDKDYSGAEFTIEVLA